MKIVYKNKEISNTTNNYEELLNLPMINSATLQGVKTLGDINTYSKLQIDELIGSSRAIEIVTDLPTNLIENTLYYVGPDANDIYDVYLVDEVRNVIHIGTSQFGEYFGGTGINIDEDNYIHAKVDNRTLVVDSEGNLHANLSIDSVPIMEGASNSLDGEKGLVPAPSIGDQNKCLKGTGEWVDIINIIYPVNSIYITYSYAYDPNVFFPGTTWEKLSNGRALWNTASGGGTTYDSLAPAVWYTDASLNTWGNGFMGHTATDTGNGALGWDYIWQENYGQLTSGYGYGVWELNASWYNSIYKDDQADVQPPAVKLTAWRRTA